MERREGIHAHPRSGRIFAASYFFFFFLFLEILYNTHIPRLMPLFALSFNPIILLQRARGPTGTNSKARSIWDLKSGVLSSWMHWSSLMSAYSYRFAIASSQQACLDFSALLTVFSDILCRKTIIRTKSAPTVPLPPVSLHHNRIRQTSVNLLLCTTLSRLVPPLVPSQHQICPKSWRQQISRVHMSRRHHKVPLAALRLPLGLWS